MQSLVDDGKIKARTKWKDIYPLVKEDERYLKVLGNPGSNPLEMFWDAVDIMDQKLDAKLVVVDVAIENYERSKVPDKDGDVPMEDGAAPPNPRFSVEVDTTHEQFTSYLKGIQDEKLDALSAKDLAEIFRAVSASFRSR